MNKPKTYNIVDKYQNVQEVDGQVLFTKDEADDILADWEFQARKLGCEEYDPNGYFKQWQKAGYRKQKVKLHKNYNNMNRTYFFGHVDYDKGTGLGTYTHYFSAHTPKKLKEQITNMQPHFHEHYPAIEVYDTMDVVDYLHGGLTAQELFTKHCLAIIMPLVALHSENAAPGDTTSWTFTQNASGRKVEELQTLLGKRRQSDTMEVFTDAISEQLAQEYTEDTGNNCVVSKWNKDGREPYKTVNGNNYYLYTGDDIPF